MSLLYFPDNKLEYIPSLISLAIIIVLAIFVVRLVINHSKKEAEKARELEKRILETQTVQNNKH